MRHDADHFGEDELELVHISRKLREALGVEELLTQEGIDYCVEPGAYRSTFLFFFPKERMGAFFWVRPDDVPRSRTVLAAGKYQVFIPDGDPHAAGRDDELQENRP